MTNTLRQTIRGILFIFMAIPGMLLLVGSTLDLFTRFYDPHGNSMPIPIAVLMIALGLLLALVGTGNWNKLGYVFVFASVPATLLVIILIDDYGALGKFAPFAVIALVAFTINHMVLSHYRKKEEADAKARPDTDH